jgi:hypothetical protein
MLKDKKAQLYKREHDGQDGDGFSKPDNFYPAASAPIWCYTRQLTQDQIFAAMAYGQQETRLFVFNYYPGVDVYDGINYKGDWYEVTRADTTNDYKGDLFIYAKFYKDGAPKPAQIKPYDPGKWE